ncbi:unnamed protein product, partial [Rotaria magnacalcarata]
MVTRHPSNAHELRNMASSLIGSVKSGLKTKSNRILPSSSILGEKLQRNTVKR